jgi:cytoskeleton protein RodZ
MSDTKKPRPVLEIVPAPAATVGEALRRARLEMGIEFEDVTKVIHVRPSQLRALEDGKIDALPGMTYAIGFVKSYADFLGLNGADMVRKFKEEHGNAPVKRELYFLEPIAESKIPNPLMIGIGAFCAIIVLVLWSIFSGKSHNAQTISEQIPPPPAVTTTSGMTSTEKPALPSAVTEPLMGNLLADPAREVPAPETIGEKIPTDTLTDGVLPTAPLTVQPQQAPVTSAPVSAAPVPVSDAVSAPVPAAAPRHVVTEQLKQELPKESVPKDALPKNTIQWSEPAPVINLKREKARVTLQATEDTWIEISDKQKNIVYKKVLRTGQSYAVPSGQGLSLITGNAGGLDVLVDGTKAPAIGKRGEILRGIPLDAETLKIQKTRTRD